jgi:hypothetical protein
VILVGELGLVLHRRLHIAALGRQGCEVPFILCRSLRRCRAVIQPAIATVVADMRGVEIIRDPVVVDITDDGDVHAVD